MDTWKSTLQIGKINVIIGAQWSHREADTMHKYLTLLPESRSKLDAVITFDEGTGEWTVDVSPWMLESRDDVPADRVLEDILGHGAVVLAFPPGSYESMPQVNLALDCLACLKIPGHHLGEVIATLSPYPVIRSDSKINPRQVGCQRLRWADVMTDAGYLSRPNDMPKHFYDPPGDMQPMTFPWVRFVEFVKLYRPTQLSLHNVHWITETDYHVKSWGELSFKTLTLVDEMERIAGCHVTSVSSGGGHMIWR
jgi:hypothetical protein